jgi:HEAT repeat protein
MGRYPLLALLFVAVLPAGLPAAGAGEVEAELADELTVQNAGLKSDGPALAAFLQRYTEPLAPERLEKLLQDLGAASVLTRDQAVAALITLGPAAVPALRQTANEVDDQERSANARRCLRALEAPGALATAVIRLLAQRQPDDAARAVLQFLPRAPDEAVLEQCKVVLVDLAARNAASGPVLLQALDDPLALRRAMAAEALCRGTSAAIPAPVRKLLDDKQPLVRLRVALALAERREAAAIDTLIQLVGELPAAQAKLAEEFLFILAGEGAPGVTLGTAGVTAGQCRAAWAAWWQRSEGLALLEELRKRGITARAWEQAQEAIKNLGDDTFEVREKATSDLMAMGAAIAPLLRQAAASSDPEVSQRAQKCLEKIGTAKHAPLSAATVRLVAYRKPAGAAEALLTFLPFADDAVIADEVQAALIDVALRDGKPDPAVISALADKSPLRRGAAAEALCWATAGKSPLVRPLLRDPDPDVRLHVALALAGHQERAAVPVLIDLLELPGAQSYEVEQYLLSCKGARPPAVALGNDVAEHRQCRAAWQAWWQAEGPHVKLAARPRPAGGQQDLGYTLVLMPDIGQIQELGADHKLRWQLAGFPGATDAQALPGDRVLVAEPNARRVSERNQKNEIVWQKEAPWPVGCQRLANGHTFIACRNQLLEVDRAGKEVLKVSRPFSDILAAHKLRDGQIVCITNGGLCLRLDAQGKEVRTFRVGAVSSNSIDVLPNGNVLLSQQWANKVREINPEGREVWEATAQQPTSAVRLHNGDTVVACQWPAKVLELDRSGKTVWEYDPPHRPARVRRR